MWYKGEENEVPNSRDMLYESYEISVTLGCQVHAYDPTDEDKRPEDSYHPNIHYHEFALSHGKHKSHSLLLLIVLKRKLAMEI